MLKEPLDQKANGEEVFRDSKGLSHIAKVRWKGKKVGKKKKDFSFEFLFQPLHQVMNGGLTKRT